MTLPTDPSQPVTIRRTLLLAGLFVLLAIWAVVFRWTGEGDSGMHYMNLRESAEQPHYALFPWARPGWVVLLIWPAMLGLTAAKIASAGFTIALCWQTMRLADDLRLPRATLAGFLVIVQPLVFYLATDTMTELPFALFLVIAIRLWLHGRVLWSMAIVGYLPLVRPEGFFFGLVFGVLALLAPMLPRLPGACATFARWTLPKRLVATLIMLHGIIAWTLACWILSPNHQPLYWIYSWSWTPDSSELYGRGSIFHHVIMWPYYCGPVLLVLFLAGIRRSIQTPGMWLVWTAWLTVFLTHTVLWWGGWFGALGLMRIQTTTAFATALVCLCGWNAIRDRWGTAMRASYRRVAAGATIAL
ncbi:MAG TPA: hypothetical protein PKB10_00945, partial [Tepidisphaeraceae bacterium]|nr:hypothetical protein [Tepidisphaeraceae bacterium]